MSGILRRFGRKDNVLVMVLAGIMTSEVMWLIRTRNEREAFERETRTQIDFADLLMKRIQSGERIDVKSELASAQPKEESLQDIISHIEANNDNWKASSMSVSDSSQETSKSNKKSKFL